MVSSVWLGVGWREVCHFVDKKVIQIVVLSFLLSRLAVLCRYTIVKNSLSALGACFEFGKSRIWIFHCLGINP